MTVRKALISDMDRVIEMALRFVAETPYGEYITIRPDRLALTVSSLMANPDAAILVSENGSRLTGMIGMMAYDHPYSGERTAFEVVWWVDPESRGDGVRLLRAAEEWAREHGAIKAQMVAPNERVGALYARLGYTPVETSYQRSL